MPHLSSNKIFSQSAKQFWQTWLFAFIWNAITWFAIIKGGHNILRAFEENPVFYFFVLFPFIGLWTIIIAIQQTLAWYKFGKTPVILNPSPGQVGGRCSGYITLPETAKEAKRAILSLSCIRSYIYRSNDGKSSQREQAIWQDQISIRPEKYGRKRTRLNFVFKPPANLPATEQESDDYHLWRLQVRIPLPGIDYDRNFELPMEKPDEQIVVTHRYTQTQTSSTIAHRETKAGSIPQINKTSAGTEFYYGYGREKVMAIIIMLFGLGLAVLGYFFFHDFLNFLPVTAGLMVAYIGFIALALFLLGVFMLANSLTVEVSLEGIHTQTTTHLWLFT